MSFFDDAISALIKPARQFGPIAAQITISERHSDRADKTSHPVEGGPTGIGNVSDHVIIQPTQVIVRMGWTNYGLQSPSTYVKEAVSGGPIPTPSSIDTIYKSILAIMRQRVPFTLVTGKRRFTNMILLGVSEDTDERTENSLILTCLCEEIFLAQTQIVSVPPNVLHADSTASGSPTDFGVKQPVLAPASVTPP